MIPASAFLLKLLWPLLLAIHRSTLAHRRQMAGQFMYSMMMPFSALITAGLWNVEVMLRGVASIAT
jgi:hypothetical protein